MKKLILIIASSLLLSCSSAKIEEGNIFTPTWAVGSYISDQMLDGSVVVTDKTVVIDMRGYEEYKIYNSNNCRYEITDTYFKVMREDIGYIIWKDKKISVIYDPYSDKPTILPIGSLLIKY